MVVKKSDILGLALILALAMPQAMASNNLVQMDLKKSSGDSVDVTLFTSNSYNDNVLVRKKSDNKYVILIPKVQSSGFSSAGLNGVKDLISNVDVKTVNDTTGGYTKVTLITTKPLNIKTNTQKSSPVSQEDLEYNTLIAQANAVRNNALNPNSVKKSQPQKTEVTVNKAPDKKEIKTDIAETPKVQNVKKEQPAKVTNKPNIKLTEIKPEDTQKQNRQEHLKQLLNEVNQERDVLVVPQKAPEMADNAPDIKDIETIVPVQQNISLVSKIKNKLKNAMPSRLPKHTWAIIPFLILISMFKGTKKQNTDYKINEPQTISVHSRNNEQYENITNNNELSWQEKYRMYLDKSAVPVARANKKGTYTFIKQPAVQSKKQDQKIQQKRIELEKMLDEVSVKQTDNTPDIIEVHKEDEAIHKTIKLKAFDNRKTSLSMTKRGQKSRFKKYEVEIPLHEQKTIELGDSPLYANPRSLKDANLKITDVDKKRIKYEPSDYIMSSVDEFFSVIDKEQAAKKVTAKEKEKETAKPNAVSNPIAKSKTESRKTNNLIVKSGFNIDENKGFYLVNQGGQNALIGKVNNEVFVLKKFKSNVTNPIQVRHDNANVYMVKAGGFKSLVEVNEDKMGVLIEL